MANNGKKDIPDIPDMTNITGADKQAIHSYIDNELDLDEIKQLRQRLNKQPELFDYLLRMERVTDQLRCAFDVKSFESSESAPSFFPFDTPLDDGANDRAG